MRTLFVSLLLVCLFALHGVSQVSLPLNEEIEFLSGVNTYQVVLPNATAQLIIKNATGLEIARFTDVGGLIMQGTANIEIDSASQVKTSAGVDSATLSVSGSSTIAAKQIRYVSTYIKSASLEMAYFAADDSAIGDLDADDFVFGVIRHATTNSITAILPAVASL